MKPNCFGVNGKYYLLRNGWDDYAAFAKRYSVTAIIYGYLSKFQNILVNIDFWSAFCPTFENLAPHYKEIKLEFTRNSNYTESHSVKRMYRDIIRFHGSSVKQSQKLSPVDIQYWVVKSDKSDNIWRNNIKKSNHRHRRNRYHYLNKTSTKNNKTYMNNKRKHRYNRW